jgi:DNA-binding GntR family transcriptional regulator
METRYAYVARRLAEDIASGRHPVGSVLPKELELAEQFKVSRATVRAALSELQQVGLVSRKRNAGTRVEAARPAASDDNFHQSLNSIEDLVQYADETERQIQNIAPETADIELASRLGCRPGSRWLRVSMLRVHGGKPTQPPICWTDIYLDESFSELRDILHHYKGLVGRLVEMRYGRPITDIRQSITAVGVPASLAEPLGCEPDTHALHIRRRYLDAAGVPLLVTLSTHPSGRFAYEISLKRQKAGIAPSD